MSHITSEELLDLSSGVLHDRCASLPGSGDHGPQIAIRTTAELNPHVLDGVSGLFVFAPVRASTALPAVKSMWLAPGADIDGHTARAFAGLEYLRIEASTPIRFKDFGRAPLRGIALSDRSLSDWTDLVTKGLPVDDQGRLQHLAIDCRRLNELPLLTNLSLQTMTLRGRKRPKHFAAIWKMTSLVALRLYDVRTEDLRAAVRLSRLSELHMVTPGSFSGIAALGALRTLIVYGRRCPSVSELTKVPLLTTVALRTQIPPNDLAAIAACSSVQNLILELGDITNTVDIDIDFIGQMTHLKSLELYGVRMHARQLSVLRKLGQLKKLVLTGAFEGVNEDYVRRLLSSSSTKITVKDIGASASSEMKVRRIGKEWTIYRDLATLLDLGTNYDAEALVQRELRRIAPEVTDDLEFDSEASGFSVASRSRKAIDIVVSIVEQLVAKTKSASTTK